MPNVNRRLLFCFKIFFCLIFLIKYLKEVEFIAGKSKNQPVKFFFIHFYFDNLIANIIVFGMLKAIQINFDEEIIAVEFIRGHIGILIFPPCILFDTKLHIYCNHAEGKVRDFEIRILNVDYFFSLCEYI